MGLYGRLESDGRVHRSLRALRDDFEVTIFAHCQPGAFSMEKVKVIERRVDIYDNNKLLEQVLYNLSFIRVALKVKPDIVYGHDYYLPFVTYVIRLLTKAKIVYDAHELMAPTPGLKIGLRERIFYHLEKSVIKKFDLVIAANEERAAYMKKWYQLKKTPLPILNIIEQVNPAELLSAEELVSEHSVLSKVPADATLFVYQGVVVEKRRIDLIIDKVAQLKNTHVLIVGGGEAEYVGKLKMHFSDHGLSNIHFLGKVDIKVLYSILKTADFGIIAYDSVDLNNRFCAPNKLYEYAFFELPMVTSSQELFVKTFDEYPLGIVVSEDMSLFEEEFEQFKGKSDQLKSTFVRFREKYNFENEKKKLRLAVKSLPKGPSN